MKRACIIIILIILLISLILSGCTTAPSKLHGTWRRGAYHLEFYRDWITERCIITDTVGNGVDVEVKITDERIAFVMDDGSLRSSTYTVTKNQLDIHLEGCYERVTQPSFLDGWIMKIQDWLGE